MRIIRLCFLVAISTLSADAEHLRNGYANHLKREDNIPGRGEQNAADIVVDNNNNNNNRELKNNRNENDALCDSATKYLFSMAAKGLIQGTLDLFDDKRATQFGRKIAEKADRAAFRQIHKNSIQDLSEESLIQITREFFDITYESAGLTQIVSLALAELDWFDIFFAAPIIPTMLTNFRRGIMPLDLWQLNLDKNGVNIGLLTSSSTFRSDFQWAVVAYNGACFAM